MNILAVTHISEGRNTLKYEVFGDRRSDVFGRVAGSGAQRMALTMVENALPSSPLPQTLVYPCGGLLAPGQGHRFALTLPPSR